MSISSQIGGRSITYWRADGAASLGAVSTEAATIELAVIVHHGSERNGNEYFCFMQNAVVAAGRARTTLVLAPQIFEDGDDHLDKESHIWWDPATHRHEDRNWKWGGNSTQDLGSSISSFQVIDEMVLTLLRRDIYPRLSKIVFAGHSAGGQIIQRYALFNHIDSPDIHAVFEYYPANPSSMTYLDQRRPILPNHRTCETFCVNSSILNQRWRFAPPPSDLDCFSSYDHYGFGLGGHLPDYAAKTSRTRTIQNFAERKVVYLSGESDVCDEHYMRRHRCTRCNPHDHGLDVSCEALAQGRCRMARVHAYFHYVRDFYNNSKLHRLVSVPGVGHNGCGMFQSPEFAASALNPGPAIAPLAQEFELIHI